MLDIPRRNQKRLCSCDSLVEQIRTDLEAAEPVRTGPARDSLRCLYSPRIDDKFHRLERPMMARYTRPGGRDPGPGRPGPGTAAGRDSSKLSMFLEETTKSSIAVTVWLNRCWVGILDRARDGGRAGRLKMINIPRELLKSVIG